MQKKVQDCLDRIKELENELIEFSDSSKAHVAPSLPSKSPAIASSHSEMLITTQLIPSVASDNIRRLGLQKNAKNLSIQKLCSKSNLRHSLNKLLQDEVTLEESFNSNINHLERTTQLEKSRLTQRINDFQGRITSLVRHSKAHKKLLCERENGELLSPPGTPEKMIEQHIFDYPRSPLTKVHHSRETRTGQLILNRNELQSSMIPLTQSLEESIRKTDLLKHDINLLKSGIQNTIRQLSIFLHASQIQSRLDAESTGSPNRSSSSPQRILGKIYSVNSFSPASDMKDFRFQAESDQILMSKLVSVHEVSTHVTINDIENALKNLTQKRASKERLVQSFATTEQKIADFCEEEACLMLKLSSSPGVFVTRVTEDIEDTMNIRRRVQFIQQQLERLNRQKNRNYRMLMHTEEQIKSLENYLNFSKTKLSKLDRNSPGRRFEPATVKDIHKNFESTQQTINRNSPCNHLQNKKSDNCDTSHVLYLDNHQFSIRQLLVHLNQLIEKEISTAVRKTVANGLNGDTIIMRSRRDSFASPTASWIAKSSTPKSNQGKSQEKTNNSAHQNFLNAKLKQVKDIKNKQTRFRSLCEQLQKENIVRKEIESSVEDIQSEISKISEEIKQLLAFSVESTNARNYKMKNGDDDLSPKSNKSNSLQQSHSRLSFNPPMRSDSPTFPGFSINNFSLASTPQKTTIFDSRGARGCRTNGARPTIKIPTKQPYLNNSSNLEKIPVDLSNLSSDTLKKQLQQIEIQIGDSTDAITLLRSKMSNFEQACLAQHNEMEALHCESIKQLSNKIDSMNHRINAL